MRFAERAEELGFDHFWVNDHVSWQHPLIDPVVLLSAVAARTTTIRLATGVYLLPLRSPAATARSFAGLDYISGGRTIVGVGVGGEFEADFAAAGVAMRRRGPRTDTSIRLLRAFWRGEAVSWHDADFDFEDALVLPAPVQENIPIIVGGRSDAALRRAATLGDGWMPYLMSPDRVAEGARRIDELAPDRHKRIIAHVFVYFDADADVARRKATDYLTAQYHQDMTRTVERCVPCGSADVVAEKLRAYVDAGATDIVVRPLASPEALFSSLEEAGAVSAGWTRG
ncbi:MULTISPECIES: TIGR03619 family F420-dependent LLM class oxidoreductase [Microcella]|uniref:LLM class flavin-dependent oxidoreductase n=1 Tax=Microcella TaxID=337004 RepID=UPI0015CF1C04|nr:TIGR03619 family F420-dependent LLM class oxidoreductase [Chryseoglobus sp. 28M-23]QOD94403.1 TIGR03619 family F420-dependent LLM class oxidoreductase [Chryseoglobus sp. 28M-23]